MRHMLIFVKNKNNNFEHFFESESHLPLLEFSEFQYMLKKCVFFQFFSEFLSRFGWK